MDKKLIQVAERYVPRKRPKDFGLTVSEFAKAKGISPHYARSILNKLVDSGILQLEEMLDGRKTGGVYFEVKRK